MQLYITTHLLITLLAIPFAQVNAQQKNGVTALFEEKLEDSRASPREGPYFESLVIHKPSGNILASRLDDSTIWLIDSEDGTRIDLAKVPDVTGISGITRVSDDEYIFGAGKFNPSNNEFIIDSFGIWKLKFSGREGGMIEPELVENLVGQWSPGQWSPGAISRWNDTSILLAGGSGGLVEIYNFQTKGREIKFRVNTTVKRLQLTGVSIYFITEDGSFYCHALDEADPRYRAIPKPPAFVDFVTDDDGITYFTMEDGSVIMSGHGALIEGPETETPCKALAVGETAEGTKKLYLSTMQSSDGSTPAKILSIDVTDVDLATDEGGAGGDGGGGAGSEEDDEENEEEAGDEEEQAEGDGQ